MLISKIYEEFKELDIKKNQIIIYKWRILNKEISNGQEALKEVLNNLRHQGNANQSDTEIPLCTYQDG